METNSISKLSKTLKAKKQQDQEQIEKQTLSELRQHAESLRDGLNAELDTTKTDISDHLSQITDLIETLKTDTTELSGETRKAMTDDLKAIRQASNRNRTAALNAIRWGWLRYSLPALLICATFLLANWGLMQLQASRLTSMQQQIDEAQQTLNQLPQEVRFAGDGAGKSYLVFENEPQIFQTQSGEWATELNR